MPYKCQTWLDSAAQQRYVSRRRFFTKACLLQVITMPQNTTNNYNDGFNHDFTDEVRRTQSPSLFLTLLRTPRDWSLLPAHQSLAPTPVAGLKAACGAVPVFKGLVSLPTCRSSTGYMVPDIVLSASYASGRVAQMPLRLPKKGW